MAPRCTAVCCSLPWPWKGNWGADFGRCGGMHSAGKFLGTFCWTCMQFGCEFESFWGMAIFLNCEYETLIGSHIFGIIFGTFSWQNCGYVWWLLQRVAWDGGEKGHCCVFVGFSFLCGSAGGWAESLSCYFLFFWQSEATDMFDDYFGVFLWRCVTFGMVGEFYEESMTFESFILPSSKLT